MRTAELSTRLGVFGVAIRIPETLNFPKPYTPNPKLRTQTPKFSLNPEPWDSGVKVHQKGFQKASIRVPLEGPYKGSFKLSGKERRKLGVN